jgi:DNA excision repair protein ERCC-4
MLAFHQQVLTELIADDALLVMAEGLGLQQILSEMLRACATPEALVLLLNTPVEECAYYSHRFEESEFGLVAN